MCAFQWLWLATFDTPLEHTKMLQVSRPINKSPASLDLPPPPRDIWSGPETDQASHSHNIIFVPEHLHRLPTETHPWPWQPFPPTEL